MVCGGGYLSGENSALFILFVFGVSNLLNEIKERKEIPVPYSKSIIVCVISGFAIGRRICIVVIRFILLLRLYIVKNF